MARADGTPHMLVQLPAAADLVLEVGILQQPHTAPARLDEGQCHSSWADTASSELDLHKPCCMQHHTAAAQYVHALMVLRHVS